MVSPYLELLLIYLWRVIVSENVLKKSFDIRIWGICYFKSRVFCPQLLLMTGSPWLSGSNLPSISPWLQQIIKTIIPFKLLFSELFTYLCVFFQSKIKIYIFSFSLRKYVNKYLTIQPRITYHLKNPSRPNIFLFWIIKFPLIRSWASLYEVSIVFSTLSVVYL